MKKMKLYLMSFFILGMIITNLCWVVLQTDSGISWKQLISVNQEALASLSRGEIVPTDPPPTPEEKRLKKEDCRCPGSNKDDGFTLKCHSDGELEKCTPTQQGSNACYKASWTGNITMCKEN